VVFAVVLAVVVTLPEQVLRYIVRNMSTQIQVAHGNSTYPRILPAGLTHEPPPLRRQSKLS
jgi:hypothetical protein